MATNSNPMKGPLPGLGPTLRAIRQDQGLSLAQVAESTGLSSSFLSLVEQGKSDITLNRLMGLVRCYNVHIADLLAGGEDVDQVVVRHDERRRLALSAEGIELMLLAPDTERVMMPVISTFEPGGEMASHVMHEGEEFMWVLSGRVALELGGETVVLEEGDCAYFSATQAHRYRNIHDGVTKVLAVITPPTL
jgi:quercetin dioxygenase-like cupin family protein